MAARVEREAGDDPAAQFRRAWLLAFSRPPIRSRSRAPALAFLAEQARFGRLRRPPPRRPIDKAAPPRRAAALAQLCQALLISNGFLYVD